MSRVTGLLEKVYKNERGFYSINVNEIWYGCYKTDYTSLEGQMVEFEGEAKVKGDNTYHNVKGTVKASSSQPPPQAPEATPADVLFQGSAGRGAKTGGKREQSIVLQSSYKIAADVLNGLAGADKLNFGQKKAAQLEIALGFLDEIARHVYMNCIDPNDFLDEGNPEPSPADSEYNPTEA